MAALLKSVSLGYRHIIYDCADPRVLDWFLLGSPLYPLGLITLYLYLVKVAIPRYMKDRPAYKLSGIITVYNLTQIVLNAAIFIKGMKILTTQNFFCSKVDYSYNPESLFVLETLWQFVISRALDLVETIIFVLRKKNNQVSTLHLYHHVIVLMTAWFVTRSAGGNHMAVVGTMNCFVHFFMYCYYMMANMWSEHNASMWWKKYLTQLQMIQFTINSLYYLSATVAPDCQYPSSVSLFVFLQNIIMFAMFYDFYKKAYRKKKIT